MRCAISDEPTIGMALIMSDPSGFKLQVQEREQKPHSMVAKLKNGDQASFVAIALP